MWGGGRTQPFWASCRGVFLFALSIFFLRGREGESIRVWYFQCHSNFPPAYSGSAELHVLRRASTTPIRSITLKPPQNSSCGATSLTICYRCLRGGSPSTPRLNADSNLSIIHVRLCPLPKLPNRSGLAPVEIGFAANTIKFLPRFSSG